MSALDRVKKDQNGNMMMPHNVAGSNYEEGASVVQAVTACLLLVITAILVIWFKDTRLAKSFVNWLIFIAVLIFVEQFVVRYFILNERYLMKQTDLIKKATNKVPADLWNVINIDDDGVIYYQDGRLGIIIGAEQATIVGRNESFKAAHYSALSDFYKVLNQSGISWTHINAMINAKQENRLAKVGEELQACPNPAIQKMCDMHLAYMRGLEIRTLYEKEYWALIARPSTGKERFLDAVYRAAENLEKAAFNRYEILTKEQCYHFNIETQALTTFDANALMIEKAQKLAGAPIAKLTEIKISTGHITDHKADSIKKVLKPYADKSAYIGTAEQVSTFIVGEKLGNIITQRIQYFVRDKRSLHDGELLSNIMNIKLVDSNNSGIEQVKEDDTSTFEPETTFMFGDDNMTAEEFAAETAAESKQATELNYRLLTDAQQAAIDSKNAKKLTAEERRKEAAEIAKQQQLAAQKAREEQEREIKARVGFDDFSED